MKISDKALETILQDVMYTMQDFTLHQMQSDPLQHKDSTQTEQQTQPSKQTAKILLFNPCKT
ncbi:MAG: hypothetical protein V3W04_06880 [Gammaproteobacteria bacterium]